MRYHSVMYSLHKLNTSSGILYIDTCGTIRVPVSWIYILMNKYKYKNSIYFYLTLMYRLSFYYSTVIIICKNFYSTTLL